MLSKVAGRYSRALYDSFGGGEKVRKAIDELKPFAELVDGNAELKRALGSDLFSEEIRRGIVEDVCKQLKMPKDLVTVLLVINSSHRLGYIGEILQGLHSQMLEHADIVPLTVETSVKLSAADKESIEKKFSKILGKKVEATYSESPSLIGGVRVTAGSRTYDGSIVGGLNQIEEQLIGGSI